MSNPVAEGISELWKLPFTNLVRSRPFELDTVFVRAHLMKVQVVQDSRAE